MASIQAIASPANTPATATGAMQGVQDKRNQFLQLLVAQLKGQNPLDPMDGTQFVSQLAQFSSLEELVGIRSVLQSVQEALERPAPVFPNPFQS